MKELKIDEEVRIRCVEDPECTCSGCVFSIFGADCGTVQCRAGERKDGRNVQFILAEE